MLNGIIHKDTQDLKQSVFVSKHGRITSVSYTHLDVYKRQVRGDQHADRVYSRKDGDCFHDSVSALADKR